MKGIETKRLLLKNYEENDNEYLLKLFTDKEVMKHVGDGVLTYEDAEKLWNKLLEKLYSNGKRTIRAIFAKEDLRYVGHASLRPRPEKKEDWEVSFILRKEEWGKGFATEISQKLIEFGFDKLNLSEIFATVDDDNFVSINVLKKSGMKFKQYEFDKQGRFSVYSISQNTQQ